MSDQERREEQLADALALALAGRPERVEDAWFGLAPPELRQVVTGAREALAAIALALPAEAPPPSLRARLLASVAARHRRALLVIDMIHDHLDPGALLEIPRARDVVAALKVRLAEARARGVPIVYVVDEHPADDPDLDAWGTHAVRGTKGAEVWHEIAPIEGDHVVRKPSYSAFFQSDLEDVLAGLNVDTLVLTGCMTEVGVMATATDAMQRGFAIEVPVDAQAGSSLQAETAALGIMQVMAPFGPARKARLARQATLTR